MRNFHINKQAVFFLSLILLVSGADAQLPYQISRGASRVVIKGTSSLHDWEMQVLKPEGTAAFHQEGSELTGIEKVVFQCEVASLKSENNLMDKKAYDALRRDDYPRIRFISREAGSISRSGEGFTGTVMGELSIAGRTREVEAPFKGILKPDGQIEVSASVPLRMSDFGVTPPTALLGTLKTGDEVRVDFSLVLQKNIEP